MTNASKRFLVLLGIVVLAQFIRPAANHAKNEVNGIEMVYPVPEAVAGILKKSCNDCHSNHTTYPWYSQIQPVGWWLWWHVKEGKEELNFSEFATYSPRRAYHKLEEIKEQVFIEKEMPLTSYTLMHRAARLTDTDREALAQWAEQVRDSMRAHYPMDSLQRKRKLTT
ncbi:MAG: heme-binding domain-containing protein [Chitinophagales bacterium]